MHRILSDISSFIGEKQPRNIILAGDVNKVYRYAEDAHKYKNGRKYWADRHENVLSRASTLGLDFVGPQSPSGRQAKSWPDELPKDSKNVPTFHSNHQKPETATRQLDFVFASRSIADRLESKPLMRLKSGA